MKKNRVFLRGPVCSSSGTAPVPSSPWPCATCATDRSAVIAFSHPSSQRGSIHAFECAQKRGKMQARRAKLHPLLDERIVDAKCVSDQESGLLPSAPGIDQSRSWRIDTVDPSRTRHKGHPLWCQAPKRGPILIDTPYRETFRNEFVNGWRSNSATHDAEGV